MGTLSYTVADSEFDDGQAAQGTEVRTRFTDITTFLNAANLNSDNIDVGAVYAWTNRHAWTVNDANNHNNNLIISAVLASSTYGDRVYSNAAQTNSALRYTQQDNASSTATVEEIANDGTGSAKKITNTGDAIGLEIDSQSTSTAKAGSKVKVAGVGHLVEGELRSLASLGGVFLASRISTSTSISNTGTETAVSDLTLTLPTNFLKAGTTLRGSVYGFMDTPGASTPTGRVKVRYGGVSGTILLDSGATTIVDSLVDALVKVDFYITCKTTGASGTVDAQGIIFWNSNTVPAARGLGVGATGAGNGATITINTTTQNDLVFTFQWASAVAATDMTFTSGSLEIIRS